MPSITIQVTRTDYPSLQVGDTAFYATPNADVAGFKNADQGDIVEIGTITNIDNTTSLDDETETTTLTCNIEESTEVPTMSDFILFAKDNKVNLTSLLGYYASIRFKNNSISEAEMFDASCEINESSK